MSETIAEGRQPGRSDPEEAHLSSQPAEGLSTEAEDPNLEALPEDDGGERPATGDIEAWQAVVEVYEREARAMPSGPDAAQLYLEIGRIWEEVLGKPRNAAMCYQRAFHMDKTDATILQSARKLFADVGNVGMVIYTLQAEIDATDHPDARAALLAEKALLLAQNDDTAADADAALEASLIECPDEPLALIALGERGEHEQYVDRAEAAIARVISTARKLELRLSMADTAARHLNDPKRAAGYYENALELAPGNDSALAALRDLHADAEDWPALVRILSASAEATESDELAVAYLSDAARLEHEKLGAADRSVLLLLKALERDPDNRILLGRVERLYSANRDFEEVRKVLDRMAALTDEPEKRAIVLSRVGRLAEHHLDDVEMAVAAYEAAERNAPHNPEPGLALGRLYERAERFQDLVGLYAKKLETMPESTSERIPILLRMADLQQSQLERPADAAETLRALLAIEPHHGPASYAYERLLRWLDRGPELRSFLEERLDSCESNPARVALLRKLAALTENAGDETGTKSFLLRLLALVPNDGHALDRLLELADRSGNLEDQQSALTAMLEAADDDEARAELNFQIARVAQARGDSAEAVEHYGEALNLRADFDAALDALTACYRQAGDLQTLEIAMVTAASSERRPAETRVAAWLELAAERTQAADRRGALEAYEAALALDADAHPILEAMLEALRQLGDQKGQVDILNRQLALGLEPQEAAECLQQIAEIEEGLGDRDGAVEHYSQILEVGAREQLARAGLARLHAAAGNWSPLVDVLVSTAAGCSAPRDRASMWMRAAALHGKLGDPSARLTALRAACDAAPDDREILGALGQALSDQAQWEDVLEVGQREVRLDDDPKSASAKCLLLAKIAQVRTADGQKAIGFYKQALDATPAHPTALRGLESCYRAAGDWDGLVALYRHEVDLSVEPRRKATLLFRSATVVEGELKDAERADAMFAESIALVEDYLPALSARRRLAEARGDARVTLDCVKQMSESAHDITRAVHLLFEAGRLYEDDFADDEAAKGAFREVLQRDPRHIGASARLESILERQGALSEAVELAVARADALPEGAEKVDALLAAALRCEQGMADPGRALALYDRVLSIDPNQRAALARLAPLLVVEGHVEKAIELYHRLVSVGGPAAAQANAFRELGALYERDQYDLVKAVQAYQAAFQADPSDDKSLERLVTLYMDAEEWSSAVNVLHRLESVHPDPAQRVHALVRLGTLYRDRLGQTQPAIEALTSARALDPSRVEATVGLVQLYEQVEDWSRMTELATEYLRALPEEKARDAVPLHVKLAEVYRDRFSDPERAESELRRALTLDPESEPALIALAEQYSKDEANFPLAVDIHRRLLNLDPFRVDSYHQIRRIFERRAEYDKAFVVCEILVLLRAQKPEEDLIYHEFRDRVPQRPSEKVGEDDQNRWITHPAERGLARSLLAVLSSELGRAFGEDLGAHGLNPRTDRFGPRSENAVRRLADEAAEIFDAPAFDLWIAKNRDLDVSVVNAEPLALVVGHQFDRRMREPEKRFVLGRQMAALKGGHHLFQDMNDTELAELVWGAARLVEPGCPAPTDGAATDAMARKLGRAISRRARRRLEEIGARLEMLSGFEAAGHRLGAAHSANRAGLLLTNEVAPCIRALAREEGLRPVFADLESAVATLGSSEPIKELLRFAISEDYFRLRQKLGFCISA